MSKWTTGELSESGEESRCVNGSVSSSGNDSSCISDNEGDDSLMVSQELRPGFLESGHIDGIDRQKLGSTVEKGSLELGLESVGAPSLVRNNEELDSDSKNCR